MPLPPTEHEKQLEDYDYIVKHITTVVNKMPKVRNQLIRTIFEWEAKEKVVKDNFKIDIHTLEQTRDMLKGLKKEKVDMVASILTYKPVNLDMDISSRNKEVIYDITKDILVKQLFIFKRSEWSFKIPKKAVARFIKAMDNLERYALKQNDADEYIEINASLKFVT